MSSIPKAVRQQVLSEAEHRCEYCLTSSNVTGELTTLFNPRTQVWIENFKWINGASEVVGITPTGRVTVSTLRLNNEYIMATRGIWAARGWHPPY